MVAVLRRGAELALQLVPLAAPNPDGTPAYAPCDPNAANRAAYLIGRHLGMFAPARATPASAGPPVPVPVASAPPGPAPAPSSPPMAANRPPQAPPHAQPRAAIPPATPRTPTVAARDLTSILAALIRDEPSNRQAPRSAPVLPRSTQGEIAGGLLDTHDVWTGTRRPGHAAEPHGDFRLSS